MLNPGRKLCCTFTVNAVIPLPLILVQVTWRLTFPLKHQSSFCSLHGFQLICLLLNPTVCTQLCVFFKDLLILTLCTHMFCLFHVCSPCACLVPREAIKSALCRLGNGGCESPCEYRELNPGSLQKQQVILTAESSLYPIVNLSDNIIQHYFTKI